MLPRPRDLFSSARLIGDCCDQIGFLQTVVGSFRVVFQISDR